MPLSRRSLGHGLVICVLTVAGFGGLFAMAFLVGAVTGHGFAAGVLLGGFGLFLLLLSALVLVVGIMISKSSKSS